jgi:DNA-binding MarR family transcriptional regulator
VVNRCVKKGLLVRGSSAEDRRVVTVALSDDGMALIEKINNHFNTSLDKVRSIVTDEEFEFILKIMQKVIIGLQKEKETSTTTSPQSRSITVE